MLRVARISSPYVGIFGSRLIPLRRQFYISAQLMNKKEAQPQQDEEKIPYYEVPGTDMNPHNYFYRVLAVPYLKFCGGIILTYYALNGLWEYLESQETTK